MLWSWTIRLSFLVVTGTVLAQQQCYFGPGASNRGPNNLVPCNGTGTSACCLLGDTCLSGNTCYNYATGDLYQYGCTDINYEDPTCPFKCGWDPTRSPWVALEYCNNIQNLDQTWTCHAPESCGCQWNSTYDLLVLQPIGCKEMGSNARVAMYAPSTLAPYVSLPSKYGGSTGYYSPTVVSGASTWVETAIAGYTPSAFTQFTTYRVAPSYILPINAAGTPSPSTYSAAKSYTAKATTPTPSTVTAPGPVLTSSPNSTAHASGLSTGAKIGIGVGIPVGAFLVAAVIWLVLAELRRQRERRLQQQQSSVTGDPRYASGQYAPSSMTANTSYGPGYAGYPPGQWSPYHSGASPNTYHEGPTSMMQVGPEGMTKMMSHPVSPPQELSAGENNDEPHEIGPTSAVSPTYPHVDRGNSPHENSPGDRHQ
ncbi:hypothetical protein BT63DRAFT_227079 [Microthyrium microscopicum]|uniref:Mid2 domain-containing protein n=1 Tax=Microthyrium microscopicum TaxID=703497 RepID=A0A6A6UFW0_9PEZI|nr:hypothetical protein BT63DRAFT_227079 [Microthyrium microscopicum]